MIEKIRLAVRQTRMNECGNCVDDEPQAIFAFAQRPFGPLALSNFLSQLFIRRGKLSGSLDDALLQFFVQTLYFLLGLY